MKTVYDAIVVGSGFGGSVSAYNLAQSGANTLLLERGPWRDSKPVRSMDISERSPLPAGKNFYRYLVRNIAGGWLPKSGIKVNSKGVYEVQYGQDMSIVCSSGVGGGSHVYSAMNERPSASNYWDKHVSDISAKSMEVHYQWMLDQMKAKPPAEVHQIPNFVGQQYKDSDVFAVDSAVPQPAMGIDLDSSDVKNGNNSFFGSASGTKRTLDEVLLKPAIEKGLNVKALHECLEIHQTDSAETLYRVKCFDHKDGRYRYFLTRKVLLGAGTLNTVKILFRSQCSGGLSPMPALGFGFGGNGDFPAYWPVNRAGSDFTQGTPSHGRIALKDGDPLSKNSKIQLLPNLTQYGFNGIDQVPFLGKRLRSRLKRDLVLVGMGADKADGILSWKKGRLRVRYLSENSPIIEQISSVYQRISERSGIPVWFTKERLLTVHPLGGARLASSKEQGVVNGTGEVYDNPGLYVVDAAALPAAPGTPPSMTIAAWASHVSKGISSHLKTHSVSKQEN